MKKKSKKLGLLGRMKLVRSKHYLGIAFKVKDKDFQEELDIRTSVAVAGWIARKGYCSCECNLKSLSRELEISENQLVMFFESYCDGGFRKLKKELRIKEAKRILVTAPDMPLSHVATLVGIRDKSNFRRQFTEVAGCSPSQWRVLNK